MVNASVKLVNGSVKGDQAHAKSNDQWSIIPCTVTGELSPISTKIQDAGLWGT